MKKPWERGYIPKPGPKPAWKGPATPEGWIRVERDDCVEFRRPGTRVFSHDLLIGQCGKPWRLWLSTGYGELRAPDMVMWSLKALLVWHQVEACNRTPEEQFIASPTGRQATKAAALCAHYGMGPTAIQQSLKGSMRGEDKEFGTDLSRLEALIWRL